MDAKKKTIRNWLAVIVTVVFFAFQMYLALVKQLNPMLQSPLHLILALTLVFLYNPADKAYRKKVTKAAGADCQHREHPLQDLRQRGHPGGRADQKGDGACRR